MKISNRKLLSITMISMFIAANLVYPNAQALGAPKGKLTSPNIVQKKSPKAPSKKAVAKPDITTAMLSKLKKKIKEDQIINTIKELASDKYHGRAVGTNGNTLASNYIADCFQKAGLISPKGITNYQQYYTQDAGILEGKPILELLNKDGVATNTFSYRLDFTPVFGPLFHLNGDLTAELYKINSVEEIQTNIVGLKNKILLIPKNIASELTMLQPLIYNNGLTMILETDYTSQNDYYLSTAYHPTTEYKGDQSGFLLKANQTTFKCLLETVGSSCHISIKMTVKQVKVPNIVGVLPGSSVTLKKETIVLSAHFDHLGENYDATINRGAFDNASGVATILEIARALKASGLKPEKTIVFVAFNGEETGLVGSSAFVSNPPIDLSHAVNINFDMVGFEGNQPYKLMSGYSRPVSNGFIDELERFFYTSSFPCTNGILPASDHASFALAGIPSVMVIDDIFTTYHSPNDLPSTLDRTELKKLVELTIKFLYSPSIKAKFSYTVPISPKLVDYSTLIDESKLKATISALTSTEMDGREIGTDGNRTAATYLADSFQKLGLTEWKNTLGYRQKYNQTIVEEKAISSLELLDNNGKVLRAFSPHIDFGILTTNYSSLKYQTKQELIQIGSYEELFESLPSLKGKLVLIPTSVLVKFQTDSVNKLLSSGVNMIVDTGSDNKALYYKNFYSGPIKDTTACGVAVAVKHSTFEAISDACKNGLQCHLSCDFSLKDNQVENILGVLPGTDPILKNQYVVVTAAFDGNGHNVDGTYNPGAVSNASGTAAILELARCMKDNKIATKKTVIFAALNSSVANSNGLKEFLTNSDIDSKDMCFLSLNGFGDKTLKVPSTVLIGNDITNFPNDFMNILDASKQKYIYSRQVFGVTEQLFNAGVPALEISEWNPEILGFQNDTADRVDTIKIREMLNNIINMLMLS